MRAKLSVLTAVFLATVALSAATAAAPPAGKVLRVGVLTNINPTFDPATNAWDRAFVDGLREHGYVIGRNVVLE
jgi:hypothetical protein